MEHVVVKKEVDDEFNGDILMNYDKPSTSADQEMPSTSGIAIKEELEDDERYIITLPQRYLNIPAHNFGSKINDSDEGSDNSDDGDKSEDLPCNVKEEGMHSDFSEEYDKHFSLFLNKDSEEKDEDEAMPDTKIEVEYHGIQYNESGTDSEVVNKETLAKIVSPNAGKEIEKNPEPRNDDNFDCIDKEKMFKCDICSKKYQSRISLFQHKKYVHPKHELEKMKCNECEYVTVNKSSLKKHLKIHDKKTYLKCHFCQYIAAQLSTLNAHIISKHKLENKGENEIKITSKIHQCTKCSYSTVFKSRYDNHVKVCLNLKNVKWFKCHKCHYRTIRNYDLIKHGKTHNTTKELQCLFCKHQCNRKISLDHHILSKHSSLLNESNINLITSKVYYCQHCKYKTTLANDLKKHSNHNH
ncbi:unnamed protein product [Brassicogethes aeneus]|uniref:C2H2-type domain-containing protein n=1 Tax=Brassicogethes aeneus TaxID=1431903 RepID=A0A9P0AW38_BRAAE|nr:unnamed protein product [Brassicogethes aeneus]